MTTTKPGPRTVYLPNPALLPLAESLVALCLLYTSRCV